MFASSLTLLAAIAPLLVAVSAVPAATSTTTARPQPTLPLQDTLLALDTFSVLSELVSEQDRRLQAYTGYPPNSLNFTFALSFQFAQDVANNLFNQRVDSGNVNELVAASKGSVQPWLQLNATLDAKLETIRSGGQAATVSHELLDNAQFIPVTFYSNVAQNLENSGFMSAGDAVLQDANTIAGVAFTQGARLRG